MLVMVEHFDLFTHYAIGHCWAIGQAARAIGPLLGYPAG
jgi:hypothetical protein